MSKRSQFNCGKFCGGRRFKKKSRRLRDWESDSRKILDRIRKKSSDGKANTPRVPMHWPYSPSSRSAQSLGPSGRSDPALYERGVSALHRAAMQAGSGKCGPALENLGKAKVLLGGRKNDPAPARAIAQIEKGCPKERVIAIRTDVVDALRLSPGVDLPSTWAKSAATLMQGRPRKPKARKILDERKSAEAGRRVYRWQEPSREEMEIYRAMKYRQKRPARGKHPEPGSRKMYERIRPLHKRKGEQMKRRRGRPRKNK